MNHRDALDKAVIEYYGERALLPPEMAMEAAIRSYMEARGVVMVPVERIGKLLEYKDADYVPNVLFDQFGQFAMGAGHEH